MSCLCFRKLITGCLADYEHHPFEGKIAELFNKVPDQEKTRVEFVLNELGGDDKVVLWLDRCEEFEVPDEDFDKRVTSADIAKRAKAKRKQGLNLNDEAESIQFDNEPCLKRRTISPVVSDAQINARKERRKRTPWTGQGSASFQF